MSTGYTMSLHTRAVLRRVPGSVCWALCALLAAACGAPAADAPDAAQPEAAAPGAPPADTVQPDAPATVGPDGEPLLTANGWGPLQIGMSRDEVVAAAGEDANPGAVGGPEPERCDEFRPEDAPEGMLVMIEQGRLTRITVSRTEEVRTAEGFGVGSPADSVRAAYGERAQTTPHKYVAAPAAYITVWEAAPPDPEARGIVYEIGDDGLVAHVHAGSASIQYVEGCL